MYMFKTFVSLLSGHASYINNTDTAQSPDTLTVNSVIAPSNNLSPLSWTYNSATTFTVCQSVYTIYCAINMLLTTHTVLHCTIHWHSICWTWCHGTAHCKYQGNIFKSGIYFQHPVNSTKYTGVQGGKFSILGGHNIGHCKHKAVSVHVFYCERISR